MRHLVHLTTVLLVLATGSPVASQNLAGGWPDWNVTFVAHRGGIVPGYPENTLMAFREAIKFGAEVIEIDLRGTKDGEIVIMHDERIDQTTNGTGKVTEQTLATLKTLDAGQGERIPTYEEALQLVAGTGVTPLLDIKQSPVLDKLQVVRLTEKHHAILNVIVGVRNVDDFKAFRALNPNLRTLGFIPRVEDVKSFRRRLRDYIRKGGVSYRCFFCLSCSFGERWRRNPF